VIRINFERWKDNTELKMPNANVYEDATESDLQIKNYWCHTSLADAIDMHMHL